MRFHLLLLLVALWLAGSAALPQQSTISSETTRPVPATNQDQDEELRREIAQMRVLIDQMQRNLAQVSSGETALKHQFDLDIQLWRMMVNRMEKQLGPANDKK